MEIVVTIHKGIFSSYAQESFIVKKRKIVKWEDRRDENTKTKQR